MVTTPFSSADQICRSPQLRLGAVVPAGPPVGVEEGRQRRDVRQLLAGAAVRVDQRRGRDEGQLCVMSKKHLDSCQPIVLS
jgi:hypothetical protein